METHYPVIIGISGGTGSGKTTLAKAIQSLLGEGCSIVQSDWYYKPWDELPRVEDIVNFDHPESVDSQQLIRDIQTLKQGHSIDCPQYDFEKAKRLPERIQVHPQKVVIVEGIFVFWYKKLRELMDLRIYVDTPDDIRVFRRVRRDMEKFHRPFEEIRKRYYKTIRPMHLEFVEPMRRWAHLIFPEGGDHHVTLDKVSKLFAHVPNDSKTLEI